MLEIYTLGGLQIRLEGQLLEETLSRKAAALLCYLALTGAGPHRRSHSRAALVGLLWDAANESNARRYLRRTLAGLHQVVAPHLTLTPRGVAFNPTAPHWLDVDAFEERVRRTTGMRERPLTHRALSSWRRYGMPDITVRKQPL